jgi:CRP/FNR family transcriptional regulator, cyclic AMP receptor protein
MTASLTFADRVGDKHLETIAQLGRTSTYREGEPIMRQGELGEFVVILEQGTVKVTVETNEGRQRLLAFRGRGELIGEMACINETPRTATVTAYEDVRGTKITAARFTNFLRRVPEVALHVIGQLTERLQESERRADLAGQKMIVRLAHKLGELAGVYASGANQAEIRIRQEDLARLIDTSEVSVNRGIRELKQLELVKAGYGSMVVPCRQCLDSAAAVLGQDHMAKPAIGCCGETHQAT